MAEHEQPEQTRNIHALLIGIDYYKPNRLYKSLKGCVRDINLVDDYLKRTLKIPAERIRKLTSPNQEDSTLSQVRGGNEQDGRYLRDIELATLLKRMTDKGLGVTVVLDSCHSGGATRGDCDIRGSQEEDTAPRPQDSLVASREELIENWKSLVEGSNRTTLVPESEDYVLLAACRPTEYAFEYAVNGK